MRGEEDVLDDTRVPFFHCGLPRGLILRAERETLGKPQPKQRSGSDQLRPSDPLASLPCDWPQDLAHRGEAVSSCPNPAQRSVPLGWRHTLVGGVVRDRTYLNGKLQHHVDDPFPAAGEVEPFRESDSKAPRRWAGTG